MNRRLTICSVCILCTAAGFLKAATVRAFNDEENLSTQQRQMLTQRAAGGDSSAALRMARYCLIKGRLARAEHFLTLAAEGGSQKACDALIAFYVQPAGIFHPEKALALRRRFAIQYHYKLTLRHADWAYVNSLEYRFSNNPDTVARRRHLLKMANALGSSKAAKELANFENDQDNPVRVYPSNIGPISNQPRK